jgi:asparagine synthase (glutamine-hydrolysing)
MSAIFGLIRWDAKSVARDDFERVLPKLSPYGDSSESLWIEKNIGLGVYLSRLYPENNYEVQPLVKDGFALVADVRLDNREELSQKFAIPSHELASISDSLLLLHAYQAWQEDCVSHLLGDFAFAIWNSHKQKLFAARDFIGARPFYYFHTKTSFAFASDLSAILSFPDLDPAVDEDVLFETILHQPRPYNNPTRTFYRDVYRLPFAHQMTVQAGQIRLRQYWTGTELPELRYTNDEEYFEHTLELLQKAVATRIRGQANVGAHISGGLDSSSVAILAARLQKSQGRGIELFSWSPPGMEHSQLTSETYRIRVISREEGLKPEYIPFSPESFQDMLSPKKRRIRVEEAVMRRAQTKGLSLMLSGLGGDEFISMGGQGYQAELFARGKWRELWQSLLPFALERGWFWHFFNRFWHFISLPLMPAALIPFFRRTEKGYVKPLDDSCFEESFLQRLKAAQAKHKIEPTLLRGRRENQFKLFYQGHLGNRMELWAAVGARYQLVYAYPLLDRRIVEFALSVPDKLFLQKGQTRYLFRQATAKLYPSELRSFKASKTETEKIIHSHVVEKIMSKYYEQIAVIQGDVPWIDKACLETRLKRVRSIEEWQSLRAAALLNFWRELQQEMDRL